MENRNTPALETERLRLRKFTENDLNALFAIYQEEETNAYLPWFPLKSLEEAAAFFRQKYAMAYKQAKGYRYAVCLKEDNIPIGYIHIAMDESYDLGYGIRKDFWHRGIATEAGKAILAQVKKDGLPYVTATHDVKNLRSGGVMKNLGMRYKYSYEEQWQPKDILVTFRLYQINFDGQENRTFKKYWEQSAVHFIEKEVMVDFEDIHEKEKGGTANEESENYSIKNNAG